MVPAPLPQQLADLADLLSRMCTASAEALQLGTVALLESRERLAHQAIDRAAGMDVLRADVERIAAAALTHFAPKAGDLRTVVSALRASDDIERMGALAQHVAHTVRRSHPGQTLPPEVRSDFAEMGGCAVRIGFKAAEVARTRNVVLALELDADDDAVDVLHERMFGVLMDPSWQHGVAVAVDVTLLARYYERFADHAVAVARETVFAVTGEEPGVLQI